MDNRLIVKKQSLFEIRKRFWNLWMRPGTRGTILLCFVQIMVVQNGLKTCQEGQRQDQQADRHRKPLMTS